MDAGFNIMPAFKAAPFVNGSIQNTNPMQFVYQAAPFLIANQNPGSMYVYDSRARLTQVTLTQQTTIVYSLDDAGNRTSVVVTCGPSGC